MHIGLVTFDVPGHTNPISSLGAVLRARGQRVTLFGGRTVEPFAERAQIEYAPLGVADDTDLRLESQWRELGRLSGIASMRQTGRLFAGVSRLILEEMPALIKERQVDALIIDQFTPAGLVVAAQHDLPTVIACAALAAHRDDYSPPCPMPWRYRRNLFGRFRNILGMRLIPPLYNWFADAATTGIRPLQLVFEFDHGLAQIAQQPAFFDFPRKLPDHFHYTAPWHVPERDDDQEFPWDWLDGRPLIYASMGTLQNNLPHVFAHIVEAIRELDVQMVLTQGGCPDDFDLPQADNVLLVKHAPQLRLLDRAVLAITHAGLNTALECLTRGVPMVCLPVTNDQPGVARRIEWLGIGEVLPVKQVTAARLRSLVERVLNTPDYREKVAGFRNDLSQIDGAELAADVVLKAFETGQKVRPMESCPTN